MPTLSLPFAEAMPILLPSYDQLDLVLIGCGGTGGWLAVNLPRIAYLQKQSGKKVSLTFIDPDRVEAKNIPRQNFIPSDLGSPNLIGCGGDMWIIFQHRFMNIMLNKTLISYITLQKSCYYTYLVTLSHKLCDIDLV
jgi:hypothetical protein